MPCGRSSNHLATGDVAAGLVIDDRHAAGSERIDAIEPHVERVAGERSSRRLRLGLEDAERRALALEREPLAAAALSQAGRSRSPRPRRESRSSARRRWQRATARRRRCDARVERPRSESASRPAWSRRSVPERRERRVHERAALARRDPERGRGPFLGAQPVHGHRRGTDSALCASITPAPPGSAIRLRPEVRGDPRTASSAGRSQNSRSAVGGRRGTADARKLRHQRRGARTCSSAAMRTRTRPRGAARESSAVSPRANASSCAATRPRNAALALPADRQQRIRRRRARPRVGRHAGHPQRVEREPGRFEQPEDADARTARFRLEELLARETPQRCRAPRRAKASARPPTGAANAPSRSFHAPCAWYSAVSSARSLGPAGSFSQLRQCSTQARGVAATRPARRRAGPSPPRREMRVDTARARSATSSRSASRRRGRASVRSSDARTSQSTLAPRQVGRTQQRGRARHARSDARPARCRSSAHSTSGTSASGDAERDVVGTGGACRRPGHCSAGHKPIVASARTRLRRCARSGTTIPTCAAGVARRPLARPVERRDQLVARRLALRRAAPVDAIGAPRVRDLPARSTRPRR